MDVLTKRKYPVIGYESIVIEVSKMCTFYLAGRGGRGTR